MHRWTMWEVTPSTCNQLVNMTPEWGWQFSPVYVLVLLQMQMKSKNGQCKQTGSHHAKAFTSIFSTQF